MLLHVAYVCLIEFIIIYNDRQTLITLFRFAVN